MGFPTLEVHFLIVGLIEQTWLQVVSSAVPARVLAEALYMSLQYQKKLVKNPLSTLVSWVTPWKRLRSLLSGNDPVFHSMLLAVLSNFFSGYAVADIDEAVGFLAESHKASSG